MNSRAKIMGLVPAATITRSGLRRPLSPRRTRATTAAAPVTMTTATDEDEPGAAPGLRWRRGRTASGGARLAVAGDGEPVAGAGDGLDQGGGVRVGFDLVAEVADVGVNGAFVAVVFVAAGPVDQLVPAVDPAGDAGQRGEQLPFGRGQGGGGIMAGC